MSRIRTATISLAALAALGLTACATAVPAAVTPRTPAQPVVQAKPVAQQPAAHSDAELAAFYQKLYDNQVAEYYRILAWNAWIDAARVNLQNDPTLTCIRHRESDRGPAPHTRGYGTNTGNGYYGAYQFSASTWRNTANHAGRGDLAGLLPHQAVWYDQDSMAKTLLDWQGMAPWGGSCRY